MNCGVSCRHGLDPELLCLWFRLVAVAPIWPPSLGTSIGWGCGPKKKKKKFLLSGFVNVLNNLKHLGISPLKLCIFLVFYMLVSSFSPLNPSLPLSLLCFLSSFLPSFLPRCSLHACLPFLFLVYSGLGGSVQKFYLIWECWEDSHLFFHHTSDIFTYSTSQFEGWSFGDHLLLVVPGHSGDWEQVFG